MLTPVADGAVATALFPRGRQLVIANSFHVDALGDVDDCTQQIVRRFTATLDPGDVSCAAAVKPVRLVPFFATHAADAIAAIPLAGDAAGARARSLASAAVQTAADAMSRWYINYYGHRAWACAAAPGATARPARRRSSPSTRPAGPPTSP